MSAYPLEKVAFLRPVGGLFFRGLIVSLMGQAIPFRLPNDEEYDENYVRVFLEGLKK